MLTIDRFRRAGAYAATRAFDVLWAGALALTFWICLITVGPVVQAKFFPVISDFRIVELAQPAADKVGFRPSFVKNYDCRYLGLTWFVKDEDGQASRHQITIAKDDPVPESGPTGKRLGSMWIVPLKGSEREMFGVLHHSCGLPWESVTVVGPFRLTKIKPGVVVDRQ